MINFVETKRTDMKNFEELKQKILRVAKEQSACTEQYKRAYSSETMSDLCAVIKDNFSWYCYNEVLTGPLIDEYKSDFAGENIFHNENVSNAYLIASGISTVRAYGSSTVEAFGISTVEAFGSSTVRASGSSTVRAYGSSTVRAYGSSTVRAYDISTVEASGISTVMAYDISTVRAYGSSTVRAYDISTVRAYDSSTVEAFGISTVEAFGSSYVNSFSSIECKISEKAILRYNDSVYCCDQQIKTN